MAENNIDVREYTLQTGGKGLMIDGYRFHKVSAKAAGNHRWLCADYKRSNCNVKCSTAINYNPENIQVFDMHDEHSHPRRFCDEKVTPVKVNQRDGIVVCSKTYIFFDSEDEYVIWRCAVSGCPAFVYTKSLQIDISSKAEPRHTCTQSQPLQQ